MADTGSTWQQEAERRTLDLLRVYNPLDEDYVVVWDSSQRFRVPAKSEAVYVRYIAEKFIREMYEKITIEQADKAVRQENEDRIKKGMKAMTKYDEQYQFEGPLLKKSRDEKKEIIASLYVGVESQYGIDHTTESQSQEVESESFTDVLEDVQKEKATATPQTRTKAENGPLVADDKVSDSETGTIESFSCDYPGCDFITEHQIALSGHKKSHESKKSQVAAQVSQ